MELNPKRKKKNNVVPLHGVCATPFPKVEKGVVVLLETLLKRAKKGEIVGIAAAWSEGGARIDNDWVGGRAGQQSMVSAVTALNYQFIRDWHQAD